MTPSHALRLTALVGAVLLCAPQAWAQTTGVLTEFPPSTSPAALPLGVAWGANGSGQIGDGTTTTDLVPALTRGGTLLDKVEVSSIDAGSASACALAVGRVYCWGSNEFGQLGVGSPNEGLFPSPQLVGGVLAGKVVTAISVGSASACAIADAQAYCWGSNAHGQVGTASAISEYRLPQPVFAGAALHNKKVSAVSVGSDHACAVASGIAYCWGGNTGGQLGSGLDVDHYSSPVAVVTDGALNGRLITSVTAGLLHTCALSAGRAYCWGDNTSGQLGISSEEFKAIPPTAVDTTGVLAGLTVESISAGERTTCAIAGTGAARRPYCWGEGFAGQLGNNKNQDSKSPVAVQMSGELAGAGVSAVSVNLNGGCLVAVGKGYCWGTGGSGRLGNGSNTQSLVPTPIDRTGTLSTRRLLSISVDASFGNGIAVTTPVFGDVGLPHPFYDDISWIAGSGIAQGYLDGTYQPATAVSRQAMAAFLFRADNPGVALPQCDPMVVRRFNDVPTEADFCGAIEWLVTAGITAAGGDFHPGGPVTRGVMAGWLFRSHHPGVTDQTCAGGTFTDVTANTPGCGDIEWLASIGVTTGYADGTYRPNAPVARQAMAAFLHREHDLDSH